MSPLSKAFAAIATLPLLVQNTYQSPTNANFLADCDTYVVDGVPGGFTERIFIDFSEVTAGGNAQKFLTSNGLIISSDTIVGTGPLTHVFNPSNIALGNGALELKVSAYTGNGLVQSAEIFTKDDSILYASVRTVQKSSTTPGVVEGNFFYKNDSQEIDWEILTSTISNPSACLQPGIWATNQAVVKCGNKTDERIPFTFDPTADFHEYRIDWSLGVTSFYIDGGQKASFNTNVPTTAGEWVWNAWSSGDPCWSNGPPTSDSITQIRSIEMYIGWSSTVSGTVCSV